MINFIYYNLTLVQTCSTLISTKTSKTYIQQPYLVFPKYLKLSVEIQPLFLAFKVY